jgi:hypothetical protein
MNKAVDRFLLVDLLRSIGQIYDLSKYTYYGFGGPFLEDCRLIHEYCPSIKLVSFEKNMQTLRRQKFHKFSRNIKLVNENIKDFLIYFTGAGKEVFWLDYTDLKIARFDEFSNLLMKSDKGTIIRITLRADIHDNPFKESTENEARLKGFEENFRKEFGAVLPGDFSIKDLRPGELPSLLQKMLRVTAEKTLPSGCGLLFQPLNSSFYNDGTPMISLAGVVCDIKTSVKVKKCLSRWKFSNLNWEKPGKIDVPILSVKERLLLESLLPVKKNTGKLLSKCLGYKIADSENENVRKLIQYADFSDCYPKFAKVSV